MPNALVIDLDLGIESGFELLRFWHGNPNVRPIPVIIWTGTGAHEREISDLFGVTGSFPRETAPSLS
jgi:DNA-binding response OmpR family regulator